MTASWGTYLRARRLWAFGHVETCPTSALSAIAADSSTQYDVHDLRKRATEAIAKIKALGVLEELACDPPKARRNWSPERRDVARVAIQKIKQAEKKKASP